MIKHPKLLTLNNIIKIPTQISFEDILEPNSDGIIIYRGRNNSLLTGFYQIVRKEDINADDIVDKNPVATETGYLNKGVKQGKWQTHILKNNGLDYLETYQNGKLHGPFIVINKVNAVCYRTAFLKGTGIWKSFYPSGKLKIVYSLVDGLLQGARIEYGPDGSIKSEVVYDHGAFRPNKTH